MNTNTLPTGYTFGWGASVEVERTGYVRALTDPRRVADVLAETSGLSVNLVAHLLELDGDDPDSSLWLVPLTEQQEADLYDAGHLELVGSSDGEVVFVRVELS